MQDEWLSRYRCNGDGYNTVLESGNKYDCPLCGLPLVQEPALDAHGLPNVNRRVLRVGLVGKTLISVK